MKRKSILMTIVSVLFAGMAWGQGTWQAWPTTATVPADVVGRDTIYFCANLADQYPIELGYDVSGRRLSPQYGEWSLISRTSTNVQAVDYQADATKNGGAGNAYKVVGSGEGGLLFEYVAADAQCGLDVGEKYWVYVFILPDFSNVQSNDTIICKTTGTYTPAFNRNPLFAEKLALLTTAGITYTWRGMLPNTPVDLSVAPASYDYVDTLEVTASPAKYSCGNRGVFTFHVVVTEEIGQLPSKSEGLCPENIPDLVGLNPNVVFGRTNVQGTYTPAAIPALTGWTGYNDLADNSKPTYITFTFTYNECNNAGTKTVRDSIVLIKTHASNNWWNSDTTIVCRKIGTESIFTYWNSSDIDYPAIVTPGLPKPGLTATTSHWFDRGMGNFPVVYGTISGNPSLDDKTVNVDDMKSNVGYHYMWRPDPAAFPCLIDPATGVPDSGKIVVIIQDPFIALDYTAQLCRESYIASAAPNNRFSLSKYTGITGIQWNYEGGVGTGGLVATKDSIDLANLYNGTYKYSYHLPDNCNISGGDGVFYLKVTNKIKVSTSKKVKYCIEKLPAAINLNDVMNIAVSGVTWGYTGAAANPTNTAGFTQDGILNIADFVVANGDQTRTLEFEIKSVPANACDVTVNTKLTIEFADSSTF
jgi:hypothetical protein